MRKVKITKGRAGIMTMRSTHSMELSEGTMNNDIHFKVCGHLQCKNSFVPKRGWQKFCSRECKDRHWQEIRREATKVIQDRHEPFPNDDGRTANQDDNAIVQEDRS